MSLIRDPATITKAGRQMMTAGGDITYTKATLYGQDISHLTKDQLESLTSIGSPLMTVPVGISDKSDNGNGTTVVLEATFQNTNLKTDLPYTAVGFFAKRGDDAEKLVLVGVANPGTYLVATPPDGIATDAADIKVAIAIGDATSVTAVVDPAGSVTPATLNSAINNLNHDITAKIDANQDITAKALDTKADKTAMADQLATKANSTDLDKTNAEVVKKADSADVTAKLDTKADKTDVANSVKQLQAGIDSKADKSVVDAEIAKIDFTPYAKTADVVSELQNYTTTVDLNKLLAGKEDAGTSYSKAELDKKLLALSTDTDGKVNADQVSNMIANKVDKSDLASDLKAVNDSIATKANSSDVNSALAKKDDTSDVDAKIKTVTDLANTKASTTDVASQISASEDKLNKVIATKANTADVDAKIKTVTDLANTKANSVDVYNKQAIDTAFSQRDSNITKAQNEVDQLKGRRQVDAQDFNNLTATGTYYVSNPGANKPTGSWGNLLISNGDGHRTSQLYFPDDNSAPWYRTLDEGTWHDWTQLASASQVTNAQNTATQANTNANGRLPLGGGNMTLRSTINWEGGSIDDRTGNLGGLNWSGGTDWAKIYGDQDGSDNLDLAIDLGDDGSNHVSFRKNGSETSAITSDGHYTGTVDWGHVNGRPQAQVDRVNIITPLFRQIQNSNNWNDIFGVGNPNNVLTSLRIDYGGSGALLNNFAAGIGFGGGDTKGVLSVAYSDHQARITGGNGNGPVWSEDIAWKSDINSLLNTITTLQNQLSDALNQIKWLNENAVIGRRFPASQATQAQQWENQNPNYLAMIEK